jgi:hypothetical protein
MASVCDNARAVRPTAPRFAPAAMALACAAIVAGCGTSSQNREARQLEAGGVLSRTTPVGERLVAPSEISAASDRYGVRTFLHFWSLLQYGAVDRAELLFAPDLRHLVGAELLGQALASNLLIWQGTKPRIVAANGSATSVTIMFQARDETDKLLPGSITLRGGEGRWQIAYFSLLDFALQRAVQLRVQANIEPLATKPNPEAVRQGDAASAIQSTYLERLLRTEAASKP